jgi:SHS2 domain-containing protein
MKHTIKADVKAATYHMLKVDKSDDVFRAQVILDI